MASLWALLRAYYTPGYLDELTTAGEVLWAGHGPLPGQDGWVSLHVADSAALTLPNAAEVEMGEVHTQVLRSLAGGGAYFFRNLITDTLDDAAVSAALWDLVWAGLVSNDTLAPLRARVAGKGAHKRLPSAPRVRSRRPGRAAMPSRSGPPETSGRWFALPQPETDATRRAHAAADVLLERHGVVTRGAVAAERVPGGFAAIYKVLSAFEESGRARRGYFIEGLGAAQFGTSGAVDRLRATTSVEPVTLAATDPANPFGAALPWPESEGGHRPGRKAGALVVLVDGALAIYVERGGRTMLTFGEPESFEAAFASLAHGVRRGALGKLVVETADGTALLSSGPREIALREAMEAAGFVASPRGLRLRR